MNLFESIQRAVKQAMDDSRPADYILGRVESVSPLSIRLNARDLVTEEFLILTDLVRDFNVDISVSHQTENRAGGSGDPSFASHNHDYKGRKRITVHNGLSVGEVVIMIRQRGGQQYCVLSRVHDHANVSGQWI